MKNSQALEFAQLLLNSDEHAAVQLLKAHSHLSRTQLFEELITPAMQHVGELWENNEITVADEHLASVVCDFILSTLYPPMQNSASEGRKKAMLLCVEGEQHYLGLKMVNSLFEEKGYETHYLGPNLPLEYAIKKAELWKPEVICLSISIVYHLPNIKKYVDALAALPNHPVILIGGRIVNQYDLHPYCSGQAEIMYDVKAVENWLNKNSMIEKYKDHTLAEESKTLTPLN
ncbi:cobalamin-dependent protein [Metabacillus idriensis]|uniref:cobalamin B12-binding domain-containing protein n=1 Tax=Metabacillus idriensis TaxID=324768 RepID=UPI001CD63ACD|nr:cobalamin-dependent protein [Metabacillus idriensis]MCM3597075.1 cobalamin-dependent protein [Metabacillus idriensis]